MKLKKLKVVKARQNTPIAADIESLLAAFQLHLLPLNGNDSADARSVCKYAILKRILSVMTI
jgi:hypothetical protein